VNPTARAFYGEPGSVVEAISRQVIREAAGMPDHAYECTACGAPCSLVHVPDINAWMSSCCTAPARTRGEDHD
jgi:hypothetical protein